MKFSKKEIYKYIKIITLCLSVFGVMVIGGCSSEDEKEENNKLSIVTTLFPQYDFARQITGDKADITLLLKPGIEAHDYDPSVSDMVKINDADLFIYTGEYMEPWAATIVDSLDNKDLCILDASKNVELFKEEHDEHEDEHEEEHEEEGEVHSHVYDPHIWTSPKNAIIMMKNILEEIVRLDPENETFYRENAEKYIDQISEVDAEFERIVSEANHDTMYFGGRFALHYFVEEYGLHYKAAFDSCSSETEPSARLVADIIEDMKKNNAKIVFYEELANTATAKAIADEVGGDILLFHSCHNVSSDDFKAGVTYVSLMGQNAVNLEIALK